MPEQKDLLNSSLLQPLAARMRPKALEEYIGQHHLLGEGKPLRLALEKDLIHSMIFWGPPGTGKTSLAHLIAEVSHSHFLSISAVLAGVKDIRLAIEQAQQNQLSDRRTILFVDEVHRFNKAQQDAFLPYVEDGTVIFIGATTENPSFELNNALLSRARVYLIKTLTAMELNSILQRALTDTENGFGQYKIQFPKALQTMLIQAADGDARRLLNLTEILMDAAEDEKGCKQIDEQLLAEVLSQSLRRFDKGGEAFYDQISALHKSVRGSNPDAALYWFCRMLDGGCAPLYIARRVVRMASEDIGNADPRALTLALNAWDTQQRLGSPEGELALAQAVVYMASAAKSNAVYKAYKQAMAEVKAEPSYEVPLHLRNAPTQLMESMDYGKDYRYDHDEAEGFAIGQRYFPEQKEEQIYYQPVDRGLEKKIKQKLEYLRTLGQKDSSKVNTP